MIVRTVDHREEREVRITKLVGFCKAKNAYVTDRQMREHHCLRVKTNEPCKNFEKIEGLFWKAREEKKRKAKERRAQLRR